MNYFNHFVEAEPRSVLVQHTSLPVRELRACYFSSQDSTDCVKDSTSDYVKHVLMLVRLMWHVVRHVFSFFF